MALTAAIPDDLPGLMREIEPQAFTDDQAGAEALVGRPVGAEKEVAALEE